MLILKSIPCCSQLSDILVSFFFCSHFVSFGSLFCWYADPSGKQRSEREVARPFKDSSSKGDVIAVTKVLLYQSIFAFHIIDASVFRHLRLMFIL